MADKELHQLDPSVPTFSDITVSGTAGGGAEIKKTTWQSVRDLFKAYYDFLYQATLVSGTNIKTINGVDILGSGNLAIPTLTDGDKGDITLSSSATVYTIDNDAVNFAKMQNILGDRILGRISGVSGDIGELTGAQINTILPDASSVLGGRMGSADKSKLDSLYNEWNLISSSSFSAGGTYNSGALTAYDIYKIQIVGQSTGGSPIIRGRINSSSSPNYSNLTMSQSGGFAVSPGDIELKIFSSNAGIGYKYTGEVYIDRISSSIRGESMAFFDASNTFTILKHASFSGGALSSFQLSTLTNISGTIKIYGRNY